MERSTIDSLKKRWAAPELLLRIVRTFVARGISAFGTIAVSYAVIRTAGLEAFGVYSIWIAVVLGIALFARFGTTPQIMKYCGREMPDQTQGARVYSSAQGFAARVSISLSAAVAVSVWLAGAATGFMVLLVIPPLIAQNYTAGALLRARARAHLAPFLEMGAASLWVAGCLPIVGRFDLESGEVVLGVATVIAVLLQAMVSRRWVRQVAEDIVKDQAKSSTSLIEVVRTGRDFFAVEFSQYFSQWGLLLVIGFLLTSTDVAVFTSLQRITFLTNFILGVVANTVSTSVSELYATERFGALRSLRRSAQWILVAYGGTIGLVILLSQGVLLRQFEIEGADNQLVLFVLVLLQVTNVATGLSPVFLRMMNEERALRNIVLASFAVQFILMIVLTRSFGLLGAAIGFGVAPISKNLSCLWIERRRRTKWIHVGNK